jgi:purine-binding chemotaxis protein CheW
MADLPHSPDTGEGNALRALLAAIEHETAQELAQDMALLKERVERNVRKTKPYIAFLLGKDEMALSINSVYEIGYLPPVTPLPNIPSWIRGIVQIRGEILSVVDCCLLFGIKEAGRHLRSSYVLFKQRELKFCLMTDRLTGVISLDEQQRAPLAPFSPEHGEHLSGLAEFFRGVYTVGKRTIYILDDEKLGSSSRIRKW